MVNSPHIQGRPQTEAEMHQINRYADERAGRLMARLGDLPGWVHLLLAGGISGALLGGISLLFGADPKTATEIGGSAFVVTDGILLARPH